jgi:hypothetical protein
MTIISLPFSWAVATVVRRTDEVRIEIIQRIFHDMGFEEPARSG